MTSVIEHATTHAAPAIAPHAPRGGSYVTLPEGRSAAGTEGTYVSMAQAAPASTRTQGNYVTLPTAKVEETEISYTRRG